MIDRSDDRRNLVKLLYKKSSDNSLEWQDDDTPSNPQSDFFIEQNNLYVEVGKWTRTVNNSSRQAYFIRITRGLAPNIETIDFFDEMDLPSQFRSAFQSIYENAYAKLNDISPIYQNLFEQLK